MNLIETYNGSGFYAQYATSADNALYDENGTPLTSYQTTAGMTAYQEAGDYYSASNPSGFISEVPTGTMNESSFEYSGGMITAYNGSAFKAGDEFPQSATEAIETVTGHSADWNATTETVSTNSGAWGGSALPISAGPGIKFELVDNILVASTDETVLWTNSNPSQVSANVTLTGTLSESCSEFEKIRFICKGSCDTNENWICPFQIQEFVYNTANVLNQAGIYLPLRIGGTIYTDTCMITMNDNTFTANNGSRLQGMTTLSENTTRGPYILQVVGINRIAGGN